jgi:hypothetical protein
MKIRQRFEHDQVVGKMLGMVRAPGTYRASGATIERQSRAARRCLSTAVALRERRTVVRGDSNCKEFRSRRRSPGKGKQWHFGQNSVKWRRGDYLGRTIGKKRTEGNVLNVSWVVGLARTGEGGVGECSAAVALKQREERIGRWCPVQLGCHAERKGGGLASVTVGGGRPAPAHK